MKAKDSFTVEKVKELKKLHGHCRLELLDGSGKVIKSQEHDNTVTPWIANAINKGNFFDSIPSEKEFPLANWFSGVMLLSKQGDATQYMIPSDARVIACANNASGSDSTDLRRGNYNRDSSSVLLDDDGRVNGYKFVWYWSDTRGNCLADEYIKAVCLTRPDLAIGRYSDTLPDDTTLSELLCNLQVGTTLCGCQFIDYEGECSYRVAVVNGKIIIKKYQLDTKQFHILGVYNSDDVLDVTRQIGNDIEITPQIAIAADGNCERASVSMRNGHIHLLTWANSSTTIVDHDIDLSDYSETSTSHTYSFGQGVSIMNMFPMNRSNHTIIKDGILYQDDYMWIVGTDAKLYKCSLTNDADVDDYELPQSTNPDDGTINGPFFELPNGDWIKYPYFQDSNPVNYYHNGTIYAANDIAGSPAGWDMKWHAINYTGYGTALISQYSNRYGENPYMSIILPVGHVATVWNDTDGSGSADRWQKTAGRTMRVIYEITEEE